MYNIYRDPDKGNTSGPRRGITFVELLQVVFVVLKLCHIINWSWVWVLAPFWISILLLVFCIIVLTMKK